MANSTNWCRKVATVASFSLNLHHRKACYTLSVWYHLVRLGIEVVSFCHVCMHVIQIVFVILQMPHNTLSVTHHRLRLRESQAYYTLYFMPWDKQFSKFSSIFAHFLSLTNVVTPLAAFIFSIWLIWLICGYNMYVIVIRLKSNRREKTKDLFASSKLSSVYLTKL